MKNISLIILSKFWNAMILWQLSHSEIMQILKNYHFVMQKLQRLRISLFRKTLLITKVTNNVLTHVFTVTCYFKNGP
jgi:hypothetical protein